MTLAGADCVICGAAREGFTDLPNRPKARCPSCGSLERHRAFAHAYRDTLEPAGGFKGLRVLLLRPDRADRVMLEKFGAAGSVGFDAMPRSGLDVMGDPTAMGFADANFDVIVSNGVLASFRDPAAVIREFARVLKPAGLALIYESAYIGKPSVVFDDRAQQAASYGEDVLDRYDVGQFRAWGLTDLEAALSETFNVRLLETTDPYSGKQFVWCVAAHMPLPAELFTDRALLLSAYGGAELRGPPPYTCTLCGEGFETMVGKDDCPHCGAPARARSLPGMAAGRFAELVDPRLAARLPLLAFSMDGREERVLQPLFPSFQRVSLYGDYASDNIQGVDMRDLSRFPDASFCGAYGLCVLDFFVEHEPALAEIGRVVAPGGVVALLLQPARLRSGMQPPTVAALVRYREGIDYMPEDAELVSVAVGRQWLMAALRRHGFEPEVTHVFDPASGMTHTWFIGRKPGREDQAHG